MDKKWWYITISSVLILCSVILYGLHYAIFQNSEHIFIYMLGDLAFLPIEVLLVTVVVAQLLSNRDKKMAMEKLNMVIGAFFSEVGTELLGRISVFDGRCDEKRRLLHIEGDWTEEDFITVKKELSKYEFDIDSRNSDLSELKELLVGHRDFMVRLIENPMLMEHESFTDLLWSVFHLTEELDGRQQYNDLPAPDYQHLTGDVVRVYKTLILQWLNYMDHLRLNYPYLFSLAMRMNPFDTEACVQFS